jgi:hypothetical protein
VSEKIRLEEKLLLMQSKLHVDRMRASIVHFNFYQRLFYPLLRG